MGMGMLGNSQWWFILNIFQVPSFADGPDVTIGRHGARRGVTAPVMQVSTAKLKQLKGEGISTLRMGSYWLENPWRLTAGT